MSNLADQTFVPKEALPNAINHTNYMAQLERATPVAQISVPRSVLVFGTQNYSNGLTGTSEFSPKKVERIASRIISNCGTLPSNPKIVIVNNSPIVLDGHHTIRAVGKVYKERPELRDKLENINCRVYSHTDLGLTEDGLIGMTNFAKATYIAHMTRMSRNGEIEYRTFVPNLLPDEVLAQLHQEG